MDDKAFSRYLARLGRKGGKARLDTMTAEQRRKIASKAGKASGKARKKKAREKRKAKG
jgi:hypothetical protein